MKFSFKQKHGIIALAVLGAAVRFALSGRILEYDEIWSLQNYVPLSAGEIFSSFQVPNNHPFNTLWMKFALGLSGEFWMLRLGSLLCSCGTILLGSSVARRIYGRGAAFYTAAALALLPPFLAAGSTARGYSGQLFLLTLFIYALLRCRKGDWRWCAAGAASAAGAVVALPTSILFLAPAGGFFLWSMIRSGRLRREHWYWYGGALLFAALWYLYFWHDFQQHRQFAEPFFSAKDVWSWLKALMLYNGWLLPFMAVTVWCQRKRQLTWAAVIFLCFPLLTVPFIKAAPARVYLPTAAAAVLLCVPQFRGYWRMICAVAALAGQLIISGGAFYSCDKLTAAAAESSCGETLWIYPAAESYVVCFNFPEAKENYCRQLYEAESKSEFTLCLFDMRERINGLDRKYNTCFWEIPGSWRQKEGRLQLRRTTGIKPGEIVFAVLPPMPQEEFAQRMAQLADLEILHLNIWFNGKVNPGDGRVLSYGIFAVRGSDAGNLVKKVPLYSVVD